MKIKKIDENTYEVESSTPGKFYKVDISKPFCGCAHFRFRMMKTGGVCKHIAAVREKLGKKTAKKSDDIISYLKKKKGEADAVEVIEKFGERAAMSLLETGQAIEQKGKIKLLK